jgi:hypothetical protein
MVFMNTFGRKKNMATKKENGSVVKRSSPPPQEHKGVGSNTR